MASNSQEYLQTRALYPETVIHLQRLVLLNADSRDAYRAASVLAKDARLIALAEHAHLQRQIQAVTLQNILWCDGNESTSRVCIESGDHGFLDRVKASPETSLTSIIQGLLDIDDYVYSCYEKVIGTIQGRGIRQLLSEQAARIAELRTTLTELLRSLDALTPSAESRTPNIGSRER
ncbi:MAG: hypothetical protein WKF77_17925 [Planctomycetaceae bacterium]